jgi:hypothetical protein
MPRLWLPRVAIGLVLAAVLTWTMSRLIHSTGGGSLFALAVVMPFMHAVLVTARRRVLFERARQGRQTST